MNQNIKKSSAASTKRVILINQEIDNQTFRLINITFHNQNIVLSKNIKCVFTYVEFTDNCKTVKQFTIHSKIVKF